MLFRNTETTMSNKLYIKNRSEHGTVLAELILVIPLFILIIGGVFEVGRMYYIQNTLEYASKEAARIGSSVREGVDENYKSKGTIDREKLESLIINSVRVNGVIEESGQFMIRYLNKAGNEVQGIMDLPFDRENNPGSIDFVEVEIVYPGSGPTVSSPIPVVFNPGNLFMSSITLMARSVFKIEGRLER